jgi:putative DNA primase/helicase
VNAADLAARLGLRRMGRGWSGNCPHCGYPGTFSVTEKAGRTVWWCASCQDKAGLLRAIRSVNGGALPPRHAAPSPAPQDAAARTRAALAIWDASIPITGTIAETYLQARRLAGETSTALRYHPALRHPNVDAVLPAMVALIFSTSTGEPVAIHRTYLRRDGTGKAGVEPAKASKGPIGGGAIMLHDPQPDRTLIVAEGIETALSAGRMFGGPAWAAIAAGNLPGIALPKMVKTVVIAADPDPTGQREAEAAARRWQAEGRAVQIATPDDPTGDFNHLLRRLARAVAHV